MALEEAARLRSVSTTCGLDRHKLVKRVSGNHPRGLAERSALPFVYDQLGPNVHDAFEVLSIPRRDLVATA